MAFNIRSILGRNAKPAANTDSSLPKPPPTTRQPNPRGDRPPQTSSSGPKPSAPDSNTRPVTFGLGGEVSATVSSYNKSDLGAMSDDQLISHYKAAKVDPGHQDKMGYADNAKMKEIHGELASRNMTPESIDRGKHTVDKTGKATGSSQVPTRDAKGRVDTSKPLKDVSFKGKGDSRRQPDPNSRPPK